LEIAAGFGRWTHYLKDYCRELWIVDRIGECIEACRQRFASDSHVHCYLNDGRSLPMIPDASVDFVFSFDSLVHTKRDVVEAYLRELGTKLKISAEKDSFTIPISANTPTPSASGSRRHWQIR
jgi:ubiquinone/menaquinone biosynthesis C-methylase UbiE